MKNKNILKAIIISVIAALAIIFVVSEDPVYSAHLFLIAPFTKFRYFANIIENMIPMIFTSLGMCFIISCGEFNLSIEGAFHAGGFIAASIAILTSNIIFHNSLFAILIAAIIGSLIVFIPSIIKIKSGGSELVASLMLNFIVLHICNYLLIKYIRDPMTGHGSYQLDLELGQLITGTRIHVGLIIAILLILISHFLLYKTELGMKIRLVGSNKVYAENIGINISATLIIAQLIGGFLAGMGGAIEILSPIYDRYSWTSLMGFGWDAVIIAILAKNRPSQVPIYAFFLAYIRTGSYIMERNSDVSSDIVLIFQALIIIIFISESIIKRKQERVLC